MLRTPVGYVKAEPIEQIGVRMAVAFNDDRASLRDFQALVAGHRKYGEAERRI